MLDERTSMAIATINPATGETVQTFTPATDDQIEAALAKAAERFGSYRKTSFADRANWMRATADLLEAEADDVAAMMTLEMGKTLASAKAEALKCAKGFRYYAEHAEAMLADEPANADAVGAARAYVRYQPLGVVLAVMPWNFPLWQAVRFAAPALMAGNVGLLKHASNVPQSALYLADVLARGGFPDGCFQTLLIGSAKVEAILRDPRVVAATLTGSEPAGRSVAAIAGDEVKHTVLELGGSDPFIVMPSADLAKAAKTAVTARTQNNGQSCIAAKRFIVHTDVYDEFAEMFVDQMTALDGRRPDRSGHRRRAAGHRARPRGRRGAGRRGRRRRRQDPVRRRETGRTRLVLPADGHRRHHRGHADLRGGGLRAGRRAVPCLRLDEAIEIANGTTFGLGSNAWTNDAAEQERFIDDLDAGAGLHQRHDRVLPGAALRRRAPIRLRPRAVRTTASGSSATSRRSGWARLGEDAGAVFGDRDGVFGVRRIRPVCGA